MPDPQATCWTLIQAAAGGAPRQREEFARRYAPVLRAYLAARWRNSPLRQDLDDAVQDVFVECLRPGGALDRVDATQGGFRAFLYGVARNVALRREARRPREQATDSAVPLEAVPDDHTSLSRVFDRAWARAVLREAARLQEERAGAAGEGARRRVELLRLRFHENLPIRDIARRWGIEAAVLHHEYAKAREEFRGALLDVVAFHHTGDRAAAEEECRKLLAMLG
ncbi:MAG TPA: sigma-70 family RNA polymerase sigma factor [Gemmataceae bacterium]|nr:sigma-70 family RNA polymerase sigma factor [Gemmataceae bacterium]